MILKMIYGGLKQNTCDKPLRVDKPRVNVGPGAEVGKPNQ
jgi:hypothetical protein